MQIVIDAMVPRDFEAEEYVIKEGEDGAVLFVVESGELDCSKMLATT